MPSRRSDEHWPPLFAAAAAARSANTARRRRPAERVKLSWGAVEVAHLLLVAAERITLRSAWSNESIGEWTIKRLLRGG